jgi:hypothetical protein
MPDENADRNNWIATRHTNNATNIQTSAIPTVSPNNPDLFGHYTEGNYTYHQLYYIHANNT